MRERLYFTIPTEADRRELLSALKNEFKFFKKVKIYDKAGEEIAKSSKYEVYSNYIDFYLDDIIDEGLTQKPGAISSLSIKEAENYKGVRYKRVDTIIA